MGQIAIDKIQGILQAQGLDGWLLYDFRASNPLALSVLEIPPTAHLTRRLFYFIPVTGTPLKIVNGIEAHNAAHLPGTELKYSSHSSLVGHLQLALAGSRKIAMEYSPMNALPYLSKVDAGTLEMICSLGVSVVPSGDLLTEFIALWSKAQYEDNVPVATALTDIVEICFAAIKANLTKGTKITEYDVQQLILAEFAKRNLFTDHAPIVGVNGNAANPHYSPDETTFKEIRSGDFVLIDLWAKSSMENSVWADITWVGYAGKEVPARHAEVFLIVKNARDAAFNLVTERFAQSKPVFGYEVDDAARSVITAAGYGEYFIHRTGHSITTELHGSGPHMDNYETRDERRILPGTSFSIEPGIYLPGDFGVRSEIDVFVHPDGRVEQTGGARQQTVRAILA